MIITIGAVVGHCGFDGFLINKKNKIALGHFHHQLHHRYFECNYGTIETPFDCGLNLFIMELLMTLKVCVIRE